MTTMNAAKRKAIATARTQKIRAVLAETGAVAEVATCSRSATGATMSWVNAPNALALLQLSDLPETVEITGGTHSPVVRWPL